MDPPGISSSGTTGPSPPARLHPEASPARPGATAAWSAARGEERRGERAPFCDYVFTEVWRRVSESMRKGQTTPLDWRRLRVTQHSHL